MLVINISIQCQLVGDNYSETSLQRTSFIADTSLQRTLFSGTNEMTVKLSYQNPHVADTLQRTPLYSSHHFQVPTHNTPYNRSLYSGHVQYYTFLARNMYTFCFGQCFTVWFKFFSIFCYFTFLACLMTFSVLWKCRNCKFAGISSQYSSL